MVTVVGLLTELLRMVSVAERAALRLGWNVMETVQLALGARPAPQLLVCGNRPGFAPPIVMLVNANGTVPVLVTVTVCGVLIVLIGTLPNAREVAERETTGRRVVPVRVTEPDTAGAATNTRSNADLAVLLFGVNLTLTVQFPPAARPVPPIGQL